MLQKDKYSVINIRKYLESDDPRLGEEDLIQILSEFSCEKNPDVERFLKKSSIEFTKKNQSITYIVLSIDDGELLGYFTIALKPLTVRGETVSNTVKKKLLRISELDEETQTYTMSAYLIAQLGKILQTVQMRRLLVQNFLKQRGTKWKKFNIRQVEW